MRFMRQIFLLFLLSLFTTPFIFGAPAPSSSVAPVLPPNPDLLLTMSKNSTTIRPLGPGCFFPFVVQLNVTWSGNGFYYIAITNFNVIVTVRSQVIANSTLTSINPPNNRIGSFALLSNIPVILRLSFSQICVSRIDSVQLFYSDGTYSFSFVLP